MGDDARSAALAVAGLTAALLCACGETIFVPGDLPGIMRLVAGVPDTPGSSLGPLATGTELRAPRGLALADDGTLYVGDMGNRRILAVRSSGEADVVLDHSGCTGAECVRRPSGLALDDDSGLLVTDVVPNASAVAAHGSRIWRIDLATKRAEVIAGTGFEGMAAAGTPAREADLGGADGIAVAADGRIFFSERRNDRVMVIRGDGRIGVLAGTGETGFGGDGGPAEEARLHFPAGIALADGILYIADTGNDRIRAVDLGTGIVRTVVGSGVRSFGGDGGPAIRAHLNMPEGVAVSGDARTLFIADTRNHRVREVDLASGIITTFSGSGETAFNGTGRDAGDTSLEQPGGLTVPPQFDLLFIADTEHHIVWRTPTRF